jgi:predicted RNA binding protein YcfA (HicA-like mRNA interferase family)
MAERIPRVSWEKCERALKNDGWYEVRQTGDHHHYAHPVKSALVTIPERETLAMPLLKSIIKQAGLNNDEFLSLLRKKRKNDD